MKMLLKCLLLFALASPLLAEQDPAWTRAVAPFRIAGNLYYVGSEDLAAYLVATPEGLILINSNLESSPALIQRSVEQLGFHFKDVKILLISHAHFDHCAGSAEVKKLTDAQYMVLDSDVPTVESGGRLDFRYANEADMHFPVAKVDRVLHDLDEVRLGGTVLTAHKTAGHTRGTTTWTLDEVEGGKTLHVVIVGGPNVGSGYKLVGGSAYPQMAADYARGFAVMKALPCDVFLGAHGGYFDLQEKLARIAAGEKGVFVDPAGYQEYIADREAAFEKELARQKRAFGRSASGSRHPRPAL